MVMELAEKASGKKPTKVAFIGDETQRHPSAS